METKITLSMSMDTNSSSSQGSHVSHVSHDSYDAELDGYNQNRYIPPVDESTSLLIQKGDYNDDNNNNNNNDDYEKQNNSDEHNTDHTTKSDNNNENVTYLEVVKNNKSCQLFLLSYITSQAGEWYTYVASIELLEEILGPEKASTSRIYLSCLIICQLMPNLLFSPFGGVLADIKDRKISMIYLDCISSIIPLFYLVAVYFMSIPMVFVVTALKSTLAAFYNPCRDSMIPLLVSTDEELKKLNTIAGLAWSVMTAIGAGIGGLTVSVFGIQICFVLDSLSFLLSALILTMMEGEYNVSKQQSTAHISPIQITKDMIVGGAKYISSSSFWPLIFIKFSESLVYGGADVLNVSFSEQGYHGHGHGYGHDESDMTSTAESSKRLGILLFCVGIGCLLGPILTDGWTNVKNMYTVLDACIYSIGVLAIGCIGIGYFKESFTLIAIFTAVRASGSSVAWINSSLLLQTCTEPDMLGRVTAVDNGLALAGEGLSALLAGFLQDRFDLKATEVSATMGYFASFLFLVWLVYRFRRPQFLENR